MRHAAERRHQVANPRLEGLEAKLGIVRLAALVVGAARRSDGLRPCRDACDVMVGIERIPIERVRQRAVRQRERHRVSPIRRLLGVQRDAVLIGELVATTAYFAQIVCPPSVSTTTRRPFPRRGSRPWLANSRPHAPECSAPGHEGTWSDETSPDSG